MLSAVKATADRENKVWAAGINHLAFFKLAYVNELSDEITATELDLANLVNTSTELKIAVGTEAPVKGGTSMAGTVTYPDADTVYTVKMVVIPTLQSLSVVDNQTLTPEFAWDTTEYRVSVDADTTEVTFQTETTSSKVNLNSKITYNGESSNVVSVNWNDEKEMLVEIKLCSQRVRNILTQLLHSL